MCILCTLIPQTIPLLAVTLVFLRGMKNPPTRSYADMFSKANPTTTFIVHYHGPIVQTLHPKILQSQDTSTYIINLVFAVVGHQTLLIMDVQKG